MMNISSFTNLLIEYNNNLNVLHMLYVIFSFFVVPDMNAYLIVIIF